MKRKVLGRNVDPKCVYCRFGTPAPDGETVLCPKRGVLDGNDSCNKFRYDPLKRVPREAPEILAFSESDFTLE